VLGVFLALLAAFLVYAVIRYAPIIGRIFEEKPLFLPLRLSPQPGGEEVRFTAEDGLELSGTYFRTTARQRAGVLVFCHEYLSDRWSFHPYAGRMLALGFDVLTFDFRNHGSSGSDPTYKPLQWATDHELRDLRAALSYLRSRPDRDAAGFGLMGVSRGGSTALLAAVSDPGVWGVITDGAFPTAGTMLAYILRWAEIYVSNPWLWRGMPLWVFAAVGWAARVRSERRLNCRFPDVESSVVRLSPRPWLMIHGEKDAYIGPDIARSLFRRAGEPKELWIVPKAKHNRCREVAPAEYARRVEGFLHTYSPRRLPEASTAGLPAALPPSSGVADAEEPEPTRAGDVAARVGLVSPVSG
jgi:pimeloyl-ACP methyl ester carboxylesterase